MAFFLSDSLSGLVAVQPHAGRALDLARLAAGTRPAEALHGYDFTFSPQAQALQALLEHARKGRTALLFGTPGSGKSTVLAQLVVGLSAPVDELEGFRARLGEPALARAYSAARDPRKRWLILLPSAADGSFEQALRRALSRAARSLELDDQGGDLAEALRGFQDLEWLEGVGVVFDGFEACGSVLWRDPDSADAEAIRRFCELCRSRRYPLFFVGAMERSLADLQPEEESRLHGVFEQLESIALPGQLGEWEQLVCGHFLERQAPEAWPSLLAHRDLRYQVSSLGQLGVYEGKEDHWIEEVVVRGNYPLHPAAAFLLPRLSAFVADPEKNAASFFSDHGPGGLGYFLTNFKAGQPDGRLSLYTLDLLYTYYQQALAARFPQAHAVLEQAALAARDVPQGRRLLQCLWLLQLVDHSRLAASPEALLWSLHLGERDASVAGRSLKMLVHRKIVAYAPQERLFRLPFDPPGTDVTELLRALRRRLPEQVDSYQLLQGHAPPSRLPAFAVNRDLCTDRYVAVRFVRREELERSVVLNRFLDQLGAPGTYRGDLVLAYVLGQRKEELDRIQSLWLAGKFRHPRLVMAIPAKAYNFAAEANEVAAIQRLLSTVPPFCDPTTERHAELQAKLEQAQTALTRRIREFLSPENLEFRSGNESVKGVDLGHLHDFLSRRLREQLGDPPRVRTLTLSTVQDPPSARRVRRQAIDYMLGCRGHIALRSGPDPVHEALTAGLVETGLVEIVQAGSTWSCYRPAAELPSQGLSRCVELLQAELSKPGVPVDLGPVLERLAAAPYSLPPATLEFLVAFLCKTMGPRLLLRGPGGSIAADEADASRLAELVRHPQDWQLELQEHLPGEEKFLAGLLGGQTVPGRPLHETAAQRLREWRLRLDERRRRVGARLSPAVRRLLELLEDERSDSRWLLREEIPRALGWTRTPDWELESQTLLRALLDTISTVEDLDQQLRRRVHRRFRELFSDGNPELQALPWPVLAHRWFASLPQAVREEPGEGPLKFLLSAYSESSTHEDEHLDDLLLELGYVPIERWQTDHTEELCARADRARRELDFQDFSHLYPRAAGKEEEFARQAIGAMAARVRLRPEAMAEVLQSQLERVAWTSGSRH
ncbi:MAG: hypothetical protein HY319_16465 [Armatimonadetes bacterium]|nr:hypothetical protein [Armatimonadota bacterium]